MNKQAIKKLDSILGFMLEIRISEMKGKSLRPELDLLDAQLCVLQGILTRSEPQWVSVSVAPSRDDWYLVVQGGYRFSREFKCGEWLNTKVGKYGPIECYCELPSMPMG